MRRSQAWLTMHAGVLEQLALAREREGELAFEQRQRAEDNPYVRHSRAGLAWSRGFDRARSRLASACPPDPSKRDRKMDESRQFQLMGDKL